MPALTKAAAVKAMKKQYNRKAVVKELDKEFSLFIRNRDKRCVQRGTGGNCGGQLTCGHLITRGNYSTRWDENNAFGQCAGHNRTHEVHPEYFTEWYIDKFGLQTYKLLVIKSKQHSNLKTADLLVLLNHYRNMNAQGE